MLFRSPQLLRGHVERRRERLNVITARLGTALKTYRETNHAKIERQRERVTAFGGRSARAMQHFIASRAARAERAGQLLAAFSYRGVLGRGFVLVRDMTGKPVRVAAAVKGGMRLDIEFIDGRVGAVADGESGAREPAARPGIRRGGGSGGGQGGAPGGSQGSLFGS